MSHEDYLEHLGIYYSQKIKILSKHPFYTSCFGMKTEKIFEENDDKLLIACSKNKKEDTLL